MRQMLSCVLQHVVSTSMTSMHAVCQWGAHNIHLHVILTRLSPTICTFFCLLGSGQRWAARPETAAKLTVKKCTNDVQ